MVASAMVTIEGVLTIISKLAPLAQQALAAGQNSVPAADIQAALDDAVKVRDDTLAQLDADIAAARVKAKP